MAEVARARCSPSEKRAEDPGNINGSDQSVCVAGTSCDATDPNTPPTQSDQSTPPQDDNQSTYADPVVGDGEFFTTTTDLSYPGFGINFEFKRSYRSRTKFAGPLGYAWDHSYDQRLYGAAFGKPYCDGSIDLQDGKLGAVHFKPVPTIGAPVVRLATAVAARVAEVSSPIRLAPESLIVRFPPIHLLPTNPTPAPPPVRISYTASAGATQLLRYDSSLPNPWVMTDVSGVVSYFDSNGNLAVMQHPAGPKMTFTWTSHRLTKKQACVVRPVDEVDGAARGVDDLRRRLAAHRNQQGNARQRADRELGGFLPIEHHQMDGSDVPPDLRTI